MVKIYPQWVFVRFENNAALDEAVAAKLGGIVVSDQETTVGIRSQRLSPEFRVGIDLTTINEKDVTLKFIRSLVPAVQFMVVALPSGEAQDIHDRIVQLATAASLSVDLYVWINQNDCDTQDRFFQNIVPLIRNPQLPNVHLITGIHGRLTALKDLTTRSVRKLLISAETNHEGISTLGNDIGTFVLFPNMMVAADFLKSMESVRSSPRIDW